MTSWDLRHNARIPFGYEIVGGKAVINTTTATQLKQYYELFLSGLTMAESARQAGILCSSTTYPNLFKRKEYTGTDYYPAIITKEYQAMLIAEWKERKSQRPEYNPPAPKGVRIYTDFKAVASSVGRAQARYAGADSPVAANSPVAQDSSPAARAASIYQRLRPVYTNRSSQSTGDRR